VVYNWPLNFIPIHAAGRGKEEIDASSMFISSYVTTLNSLWQAQQKNRLSVTGQPKFSL